MTYRTHAHHQSLHQQQPQPVTSRRGGMQNAWFTVCSAYVHSAAWCPVRFPDHPYLPEEADVLRMAWRARTDDVIRPRLVFHRHSTKPTHKRKAGLLASWRCRFGYSYILYLFTISRARFGFTAGFPEIDGNLVLDTFRSRKLSSHDTTNSGGHSRDFNLKKRQ